MSQQKTAERVRRLVDEALSEWVAEGLPIQVENEAPRETTDTLQIAMWIDDPQLTTAKVRRTMHVSEGEETSSFTVDIFTLDRKEAVESIRTWIEPVIHLLRQDVEIRQEGGNPAEPGARWHRAHPLLVEAIRQWGWNADDVVRGTSVHTHKGLMFTRGWDGIYTDLMKGEVEGMQVVLTRRLNRRRVIVDSLTLTPEGGSSRENPRILFSEQQGNGILAISPMVLPDTAVTVLAGRKVGEVLAGGAAAPFAQFTIADIMTSDDTTMLILEDGEATFE